MRLNGFRSVPRREPLPLPLPPPYVGNINKMEQLSQLESESLNTGRQPSYAAGKGGGGEGGQLPGEDNVDTVFPRERQRSEEICRARVHGDQDPGRWRRNEAVQRKRDRRCRK